VIVLDRLRTGLHTGTYLLITTRIQGYWLVLWPRERHAEHSSMLRILEDL
jgi:hypothetical protein